LDVDFTKLCSSIAIKIESFVVYAELSSLLLAVGWFYPQPCLPNALVLKQRLGIGRGEYLWGLGEGKGFTQYSSGLSPLIPTNTPLSNKA
jgi:hypothetical protein